MTLARFTPSILPGETLEQLFVHRHHLLDDVMSAVRDAAEGDGRRHRLFVGPRGAGKTHLISLVNHRVEQARADGLRVGLSWLMEDPWDIETYEDLISEIEAAARTASTPAAGVGEQGIEASVDTYGPLVVLIENLDQVLRQIGVEGQRQLRALLENRRSFLLVATSTRLTNDLLVQSGPFYGFFDVTQLEPFTVSQAGDMLQQIARKDGDLALHELMASPLARSRLATIAHLAGGQPRVWTLLGTGLRQSSVNDMVDNLLSRFDDLTPYYQEQLARLSPSERKAVRRLADANRPLTVRALAQLAESTARSMSKTISDLRKQGWVKEHNSILTAKIDGRVTYYELAEPLARIAFQLKSARGRPVRLAVDFLAAWFESSELMRKGTTPIVADYLEAALRAQSSHLLAVRALSTESDPGQSNPDLLPALADIEDALELFDRVQDPSLLLELPASVSSALEQILEETTPALVRSHVCVLAVANGADISWLGRLDRLANSKLAAARGVGIALLACVDDSKLDLHLANFRIAIQAGSDVENSLAAAGLVLVAQSGASRGHLETLISIHRSTLLSARMDVRARLTFEYWVSMAHVILEQADAGIDIMRESYKQISPGEGEDFQVTAQLLFAGVQSMAGDFNGANATLDDVAEQAHSIDRAAEIVNLRLSFRLTYAISIAKSGPVEAARVIRELWPDIAPIPPLRDAALRVWEMLGDPSFPDGVPDGLGLGEGLEAGEAGVGGE